MADGPTLTLGTAEVKIKADLGPLKEGFDRAAEAARKFERAAANPNSIVAKHYARIAQEAQAAAAKTAKAQADMTAQFDKGTREVSRQSTAMDGVRSSAGRFEASIGRLVNRYVGWIAVMQAVRRLAQEAIRTDAEAAAAAERLGEAYKNLAKELGPTMAWLQDRLTDLVVHANNVVKGIKNATEEIGRAPIFGGVGNKLANSPQYGPTTVRSSTFDSQTKNWDVGAGGFPGSGLTDLTEIAAAEKKIMDERQRGYDAEAEAIHSLSVARQKMYDDWSNSEEKRQAEFKKGLLDGLRTQAEVGVKQELAREDTLEKELEQALEYLEKLGEASADASAERVEREIEDQQRAFDRVADYWEDVNADMSGTYKDFWLDIVDTGELNFESLGRSLRRIWASVLFDMAQAWAQQRFATGGGSGFSMGGGGMSGGGILGGISSLFGGASATYNSGTGNWTPGPGGFPSTGSGFNYGAAAGIGLGIAAGVAKAQESPGDNTRLSSGLSGAATGAMIGSFVGPIGTAVGAIIGGIIGLISGGDKISDFRSVATFVPGMTDFGVKAQSAHEMSAETLGYAEAAGDAIAAAVTMLKSAGIEFKSSLSNIWIGSRDESTYQLAGGQRIGVGSTGDAGDLALDVINALLMKATSSDPEIKAILAKTNNLAELEKALAFRDEITYALGQITDPLKAAIDLWKKESQARLDMAAATGVSIEKVQQLNTALYQQIVSQQNAAAIASVTSLMGQLQYGDLSAASPGAKFDAGLSEFNKLRDAALSGGAKEAEAFAQFSSGFLPQARDYLGTSVAYGNLQSSTLSTLQSLMTSLSAPQVMPDLTIPLQAGFSMTVVSIEALHAEVKGLRADNQNLSLQIAAMARTVPA